MTPAPIRIDLWRGVRAFLFTLALPVSLAFTADLLAGSLPWLTIAAVLICIPLATVVVNRTILGEFDRVVSLVAPKESEDSGEPQERQEDFTDLTATLAPTDLTATDLTATDLTPTGWPTASQPFTEGAQTHHG